MTILGRKILITGSRGLASSLAHFLGSNNTVACVDRHQGRDIASLQQWANDFSHYDIVINNAYQQWCQISVLEFFHDLWQHDDNRMIVNIGSTVSDYVRSEKQKDHCYWPYRIHKQSLQSAFETLCRSARCDIKLINPGPMDTNMAQHLYCEKMSTEFVAEKIIWVMQHPEIKRIDLWR